MDAQKQPRPLLVAHVLMLAVFLGAVIFVSIKFGPAITRLMSRPEKFREYIDGIGPVGALFYILIQVAHVIIVVVPGEIVQIAAGYAFGTFLGTLYSLAGIIVGTVIVFFGTRLAGYAVVRAFISPKTLKKFDFLINSPKSEIILFVLFLIPGFPKDALIYISGLTPVNPWKFLLFCVVARFPGLWGSAYIGAHLQKKEYWPVGIMSGVALILFIAGILAKDKIIHGLHRFRSPGAVGRPGR